MTIELTAGIEDQLRRLAARQGRDVYALIEEAVLKYIESAAITDLEPGDVAESQIEVMDEFHGIPGWKNGTG